MLLNRNSEADIRLERNWKQSSVLHMLSAHTNAAAVLCCGRIKNCVQQQAKFKTGWHSNQPKSHIPLKKY